MTWDVLRRAMAWEAAVRREPGAIGRQLWLALSAVLFAFPGYASDVLGLLLLLPPVRKLVRRGLMHWVRTRFRVQVIGGHEVDDGGTAPVRSDQIIDARVIETRIVD